MAGAKHAACTVEMASVVRPVDVAVVDEIQMVADSSRGYSFTRAILGIPAQTLHVCGDHAALPLLQQLVQDTGEIITAICHYFLLASVHLSPLPESQDMPIFGLPCLYHESTSKSICQHFHSNLLRTVRLLLWKQQLLVSASASCQMLRVTLDQGLACARR